MTSGSKLITYKMNPLSLTAYLPRQWIKVAILMLPIISCSLTDITSQSNHAKSFSAKGQPQETGFALASLQKGQTVSNTLSTMCPGGIIDARRVSIPQLSKPAVHVRYIDPALGASVIRITDSKAGEVRKPVYSTMQAWNADESLLLLYRSDKNNSGHELRHGHTYELIRQLKIVPADIEDIFWSHNNPDELFYISGAPDDYGKFNKLNLQSSKVELIKDFSAVCGSSLPVAGDDVHMQSYDDDNFGFRCQKTPGNQVMFSYRISTNKVNVKPIGKTTDRSTETAPTPTPSGKHFWYQGKILDANFQANSITADINSYLEHSSIGTTHAGQDALYQVAFGPSPAGCDGDPDSGIGHLVQHNLETGACRNIINQQQGYPYPTSGTHLSALSVKHPGRVAMSSIGSIQQTSHFTNNTPAPALYSEIYLADTFSDLPVVCRLAHHRSFGKNANNGGYTPYFGEPHASLSPSGTRIIFGSDWYDSGSVDSYVIELPAYTPP